MKQIIRFILPALLISIVGCSKNDHYPLPSVEAKSNSFVIESKPFKTGSGTYDADYGTITVPENRSKPASRFINIPFFRVHSHVKNSAEPIFFLSGGPGQSNLNWDIEEIRYLLTEHDLVMVGYRGVDGSTVLDCPELAKTFTGNGDLLDKESMEAIGHAWTALSV